MNCATKFSRFTTETATSNPKVAKVDTNIFEVNLECLNATPMLSTGDPYKCSICNSILSSSSQIHSNSNTKSFTCSCCGHSNEISLEDDEIPNLPEQNYLLEGVTPTISTSKSESSSSNNLDSSSIVFCIDTSGSMAMSKEVDSSQWVKTKKTPNKEGQVKVSRLECVQAAVDSQLKEIEESFPLRKVGLVHFSSSVTIVGDGQEVLSVDRMIQIDFGMLMSFAQSLTGRFLNLNIRSSYKKLVSSLYELKASGGTALGPALLVSIILASEGGPGSKVVICTDGEANEGVGSLSSGAEQFDFYKEIGSIANQLGVSVSVISIEGQECKLEALNLVTSQTQGDIVKVNPESLLSQFSNIVKDEIIATEVFLQVNLHKSVKFYNEKNELLSNNESTFKKFIGNATQFTAFSFQYILKSDEELQEMNVNKNELRRLHLQASITYRAKDGNKYLKVLNQVQDVLFGDEPVEEKIDSEVMMRAGRREAARLLEEGKVEDARIRSNQWALALNEEVKNEKREAFNRDMKTTEKVAENFRSFHLYTDTGVVFINRMKRSKED